MKFKNNITAFFVIGLLGSLGHFFYKWSGNNQLVGMFFPVNESTWEHLKLLFFPTLIYSLFEYIFSKEKPCNYLSSLAVSLLWGMGTIVVIFYTVRGVLGFNVDFINILIYFIAIISMLSKKNKLVKNKKLCSNLSFWSGVVIIALFTVFFVSFSFNPPQLGIFAPPKA